MSLTIGAYSMDEGSRYVVIVVVEVVYKVPLGGSLCGGGGGWRHHDVMTSPWRDDVTVTWWRYTDVMTSSWRHDVRSHDIILATCVRHYATSWWCHQLHHVTYDVITSVEVKADTPIPQEPPPANQLPLFTWRWPPPPPHTGPRRGTYAPYILLRRFS